jgi:hypothetical protein
VNVLPHPVAIASIMFRFRAATAFSTAAFASRWYGRSMG